MGLLNKEEEENETPPRSTPDGINPLTAKKNTLQDLPTTGNASIEMKELSISSSPSLNEEGHDPQMSSSSSSSSPPSLLAPTSGATSKSSEAAAPCPLPLPLPLPLPPNGDTERSATPYSPSSPSGLVRQALHMEGEEWAEFQDSFQHNIAEPGRNALHNFFYPSRQQQQQQQQHQRISSSVPPIPMVDVDTAASTRQSAPARTARTTTTIPTPITLNTENVRSRQPRTDEAHTPTTPITNRNPPHRTPVPSRRRRNNPTSAATPNTTTEEDPNVVNQDRQDREYVERFWTAYDDIIILSLFTQLGILCRLGMASWFRMFDGVFHKDSALFTNLPLNCLSCFVMGMLCSGESLMQIISTRFTPPRLQQDLHREGAAASATASATASLLGGVASPQSAGLCSMDDDDDDELEHAEFESVPIASAEHGRSQNQPRRGRWRRPRLRLRRPKRRKGSVMTRKTSWQPKDGSFQNELREVQLLALERRIRSSPCLVLFPVKKEDVDVVENYFGDGYRCRDSADSSESGGVSMEESKEEIMSPLSGGGSMTMVEDIAFSFDHHDLALEEEMVVRPVMKKLLYGSRKKSEPNDDASLEDVTVEVDEDAFLDELREPPIVNRLDEQGRSMASGAHSQKYRHAAVSAARPSSQSSPGLQTHDPAVGRAYAQQRPHLMATQYGQVDGGNVIDYGAQEHPDLDQIITNVATGVSKKISRISRVSLADGWDVGTSPEEKSDDLMLGLRDGLCGALSSFSSWISSMVNLLRGGNIGQAFVGLVLGIQLPLVAYRFGQNVAVYIFVWRCRRETKRDERRGYGIRLNMDEGDDMSDEGGASATIHSMETGESNGGRHRGRRTKARRMVQEEDESETPSVRAIITALFIMTLVAQMTSLNFFYEPEDRLVALSLLFSPLGVLTRWRLSKFNSWRPGFPIGTFACNIGACALSGTLGSLLAGNPGPRERIALVAIVAGFGGTLSSVARFIVEILAGMDPILFRMDGVYYAVNSVFWGLLVSFLFTASVDWADSVE